jgi:hypothetical protein|tara:strand:- start:1474 stop:2643 length:1170 start_codon:yes stop_codon:yes gene_type:complete
MADRLDDELSQSMRSEIEMEGATITGGMPTFEFLNKDYDDHYLGRGTASAEVFTLPNGQKIALVPDTQAVQFLAGGGVTGLEENIHGMDVAVDYRKVMNPTAVDSVVAARDMYERLMSGNAPRTPENVALGEQRRRILGNASTVKNSASQGFYNNSGEFERVDRSHPRYSEANKQVDYENWKNQNYTYDVEDKQFGIPTVHLGNGMHMVLGAKQEYQDKESFGTYEMTDDGPVLRDPGKSTQSIPIIIYSDPDTGSLSTKVPEASHLRDQGVHIDRSVPLTARDNVTPSGTAHFHDIRRAEVSPDLIPGFTGRDVIEGYKTAKAGQRAKPPAPIEPAPEPRPDPPSSFEVFEMPIEDTSEGKRRVPMRFSSNRDLSDDLLVDSYKMRGD